MQKVSEKTLSSSLKELNKLASKFSEDFSRYRVGKVSFKRQVKVGD